MFMSKYKIVTANQCRPMQTYPKASKKTSEVITTTYVNRNEKQ
jgi:hypothetical protein